MYTEIICVIEFSHIFEKQKWK